MRTLQDQLQDISDWMAGIDLDPKPTLADFAEGPLRAAWSAISSVAWDGNEASYAQRCLVNMKPAMFGYPNGPALYERIQRVIPSTNERPFRSLAEIAADLKPVSWLWPGWLPVGMLTLLAAKPGTGKSLIALDLAHRIITGQPWPDGTPGLAAGPAGGKNVIYVDGENIPEVHNDRAVAWQMQRENLYLLLPSEEDILLDLNTVTYQELLAQMVYRLDPALVIIDSLGAVMGKGENAVEDVRELLGFLAGLAQHHATAILLIHHLRKSTNGQLSLLDGVDPDMIRGSGHITAMSRVAWGLSTVQTTARPDPNGPRKLAVIKSNLSRHPEPLGVTLEPIPGRDNVRVVYADDAPAPYQEPTEQDQAAEWLLDYLETAGEPVPPKDIVAAAAQANISRAAIYRARETLRNEIVNTIGRRATGNCWRLAAENETETAN